MFTVFYLDHPQRTTNFPHFLSYTPGRVLPIFLFSLFINFPTSLPFRLELGTNPSGHFRGLHALHLEISGGALFVLQDYCFDITAQNIDTTRDLNRAFLDRLKKL